VADAIFEDPRLASVYDPLDPDRSDLDVYVALAEELGARSVLDIGCGTGTFACMLAQRGLDVTAVDPARASLDVARAKRGARAVRWLHGDATSLPPLRVDAAFMTANVAQVFLTDDELAVTLTGIRAALRPGGWLAFETRDPSRRAWERWDQEHTYATADVPGVGRVTTWCDLVSVDVPLVTFRWTNVFGSSGDTLTSNSTLRFWERDEMTDLLTATGFDVLEVRDAPDRPGAEFVFVAEARP
jgi:SAM-dependent methyltransferase